MTDREITIDYIWECIRRYDHRLTPALALGIAMKAAREEREACARLLENGRFLHDEAPAAILAKEAAKAIRKRGER